MVFSYFQLAHSILIHFCATQKIVQKSFAFGLYSTFTTVLLMPLGGSGAPLPPLPWTSAAAARHHHCLAAAAHWQPRRRQRRGRRCNPMVPIPAGPARLPPTSGATLPPASAGVQAGQYRRILSGSAALCAELEQ